MGQQLLRVGFYTSLLASFANKPIPSHLRTYRALIALEPTRPDVQALLRLNGVSQEYRTYKSLKELLGVAAAGSSPIKSPSKRALAAGSGSDGHSNDEEVTPHNSRGRTRR